MAALVGEAAWGASASVDLAPRTLATLPVLGCALMASCSALAAKASGNLDASSCKAASARLGHRALDEGGADAASGTCTVRMDDGRLKYLVEMDDLRHFRAGAFHTGDIVSHEATGMAAAVAEFDEDSDTYTLLLRTGQLQRQ